MELDNKLSELFKAKDKDNVPKETNSVLELKKIEQQLNLHLKNKEKLKYKKVTVTHDKSYDEERFSEVINEEIKSKLVNKKWKSLPMYLKWQILQEYFTKNDITDEDYKSNLKLQLQQNTLQVEYENRQILKII